MVRYNSPVSPSITTSSPSLTSVKIPFTPTTAGNSSDLAIIAEWAVFPPTSVINPIQFSKSN